MSATTTLPESLPELLAPARATEPNSIRLYVCLHNRPVYVVDTPDQPEACRVFVTSNVPETLVPHWLAIIRRALEDAGFDIAHRIDDAGRPCIAIFRPGAP